MATGKQSRRISAPKWLSGPGQWHYKKIVEALEEKGLYDPADCGALEMLASLYGDFRDPDISPKDKRDSMKLYVQICREYGGTPASRQALRIRLETKTDEDPEKDLLEMMEE